MFTRYFDNTCYYAADKFLVRYEINYEKLMALMWVTLKPGLRGRCIVA